MANYNSAISICTSDSTKLLGATKTTKSVNGTENVIFGGDKYPDLRTYNDTIDSEGNRNKELCKEVTDRELNTKVAYPLCASVAGPGFIRSPRDLSKCIAFDCPPDWERDGDICKKPLQDAIIDKRSHCDERWYDWIVIPNYHLGNKFAKGIQEGICYAPCRPHNVPAYLIDPLLIQADDTTDPQNESNASVNIIDRCISKTNFMMGKYENTPEYCPLAWVFRIYYTTPKGLEDLKLKLKRIYENYLNNKDLMSIDTVDESDPNFYMLHQDQDTNQKPSDYRYHNRLKHQVKDNNIDSCNYKFTKNKRRLTRKGKHIETEIDTTIRTDETGISKTKVTDAYNKLTSDIEITKRAMEIVDSIGSYLENIPPEFDQQTCDACNSLSTNERITEAYQICSLYSETPELDDSSDKINILKQACNALFSKEMEYSYKSNASELLINNDLQTFQTKQSNIKDLLAKNDDPHPVSLEGDTKNVYKMGNIGILIIVIPIIVVLIVIIFIDIIWPYLLKPLFDIISRYIFGVPQGVISYVNTAKEQNEFARRENAYNAAMKQASTADVQK